MDEEDDADEVEVEDEADEEDEGDEVEDVDVDEVKHACCCPSSFVPNSFSSSSSIVFMSLSSI